MTITLSLSDLTPVTDALPPIGTVCLIYTVQGGFAVATYTDKIGTVGKYKEPWFTKSGRQMSKNTILGWCELGE